MGKKKFQGPRVRALIFDLDGTLIDSGLDIAVSANFTRVHFGLPELSIPEAIGHVGDGVAKLMERCLRVDGVHPGPERIEAGLAVFREHYANHCLDNTRLYPGVLRTLAHFHRLPLMVATNKPRAFTLQVLEALHIDGAFVKVIAGDDIPQRKPHPDPLLACLDGMGIPPGETAMIGDHLNDIKAARACGAVAVGVTYGLRPPAEIKAAKPDILIDSFTELVDCFPSRDSL